MVGKKINVPDVNIKKQSTIKNITVYPTIWQTLPYSFYMEEKTNGFGRKTTKDIVLRNFFFCLLKILVFILVSLIFLKELMF